MSPDDESEETTTDDEARDPGKQRKLIPCSYDAIVAAVVADVPGRVPNWRPTYKVNVTVTGAGTGSGTAVAQVTGGKVPVDIGEVSYTWTCNKEDAVVNLVFVSFKHPLSPD